MLAGFELNLAAMSLVSVLVGMFLIYNTVSASVVRRRGEIGILRSLGATLGEVRGLFLGEAIVFEFSESLQELSGNVARQSADRNSERNDFISLRAGERATRFGRRLDLGQRNLPWSYLCNRGSMASGRRRSKNGSCPRAQCRRDR